MGWRWEEGWDGDGRKGGMKIGGRVGWRWEEGWGQDGRKGGMKMGGRVGSRWKEECDGAHPGRVRKCQESVIECVSHIH